MTQPVASYTGPRIGDRVQVETPARVVELRALDGEPGAIVEFAPGIAVVSGGGEPDRDQARGSSWTTSVRVWVPLALLVVLRPASDPAP